MRGEDSRRATVAYEMFDTGDWIVPRQQHIPYLSRPPLHSWAMAALSRFTGDVDYLAIRLPSVLGVFGMVTLVYFVAHGLIGRTGALVGGAALASMPQVMELGRFGETDAMFSCLVSASLLIWLAGYGRNWPKSLVWSLGYGLAALGTLTKGIQALPYFAGATWLFLAWKRDWKWLFGWPHLIGIGVFTIVFGAWALPFAHTMGLAGLYEIFHRDSADQWKDTSIPRFAIQAVTMPLRVGASVAPWVVLLLLYLRPQVRRFAATTAHSAAPFLLIALAVAWPTVWFSPTAHNRHFMPLYPCIAMLVAIAAAAVLHEIDDRHASRGWMLYLGALSVLAAIAGVAVAIVAVPGPTHLPGISPLLAAIVLPGTFAIGIAARWASRRVGPRRMTIGALAVAAFMGLCMVGPVQSMDVAQAVDVRPNITQLKQRIGSAPLVSYGPISHLFAYYYRTYIPQLPFPQTASDPSADVDYFCFYGGTQGLADPKLPFKWETIGEYSCDRQKSDRPKVLVVVGRRIRDATTTRSN
jgi:4-amino-4-deoxy-L-arabinose transferase-like glycosyltransferase